MEKIYQLLSLCQKGRNLVSGEFAVRQAVLDKKAFLTIVATDASNNTKKLFNDKCNYRKIPVRVWGDSDSIGKYLGKEHRVVIGIVNEKLATKLVNMIDDAVRIGG
ncbi:L7Ae/L30e/S12e/Gadd45 family ribosomal protein [Candidatus Epulonipiscium viviparus]|uniref:L7Ae/L30e/S12e/Gadd45 family ribosomal protein n=1 Tax=Candidatus Epulonipiscium viviparus TaxID=420336 RepID=UPI00273814C5|nr:ribosomal L7Ae/L30e/S12e/Gadd45 family protein [Candidatus Epulopiscium viviparus]